MYKLKNVLTWLVIAIFILNTQNACSTDKASTISIDVSPKSTVRIQLKDAFKNLSFQSPVAMAQPKPGNGYWYVVERTGKVFRVPINNENTHEKVLYLDYSRKVNTISEGGLLSLAFDPEYPSNRTVYISYTETSINNDYSQTSVIARLTESSLTGLLDNSSEHRLLELGQPYNNHNGGQIAFGPDNYLYIGFGDGGSGGDPHQNGQNRETLLGSLLRIDVSSGDRYSIPEDNPFVGKQGRDEIFAYGLRNPWRWSFDSETGQLWLSDVGQNSVEEVNIIQSGNNYGWNCYEGYANFNPENCTDKNLLTFPVAQYSHKEGSSITGGYVYRGILLPELSGNYIFGDFTKGKIWHLKPEQNNTYSRFLLLDTKHAISSFAESNERELYILDFYGGKIFHIIPHQP